MIKFKFDKDTLLIMQEGDTEEYPTEWIPKSRLGDLDDFGEHTSFWISYLSRFSFISKSSLYFLAKIIQDNCPGNKIDWFKTFYNIEMDHMVAAREKVLSKQSTGDRKCGARDYNEIIKTWSEAAKEIKATVPTGKIVALVAANAAKYKVSIA